MLLCPVLVNVCQITDYIDLFLYNFLKKGEKIKMKKAAWQFDL